MLVFATLLATLSSTVRSRFWSPGRVLKRKQNLTSQQNIRLRELLRYNLQTVRAYLLKEDFQAVLGIQLAHLGRQFSGFLVLSNHAFPHRAYGRFSSSAP